MSTISKEKKAGAIIALAIILASASGVYQLSQIEKVEYQWLDNNQTAVIYINDIPFLKGKLVYVDSDICDFKEMLEITPYANITLSEEDLKWNWQLITGTKNVSSLDILLKSQTSNDFERFDGSTLKAGETYQILVKAKKEAELGASIIHLAPSIKGIEISISSPSPGTTATKYVSNKTVTYSATVNRSANCKWAYQSGALIEWDNSTTSPSTKRWINSSSVTSFNITLTAYDVDYPSDNDSVSWNNPLTNDVYNPSWTWERLGYYDGYDFAAWTGLAIGGDVDNDGVDEFCAFSRMDNANGSILIQELDRAYRIYDSLVNYPTVYDGTALHDVDGDGMKEVVGSCNQYPSAPLSSIYTFNAASMVDSNTNYNVQTSGSSYAHGIAWFTIGGVESYYYAGCGEGEVTRVVHNYATQSKQEIDDFANSGDGTIEFDIDGDGQDELLAVEGWCTGCAKVYAYEINTTTGAYDSKTLIYDNDLTGGSAFSVELFKGDIDNDGTENLILLWMYTNTWCGGDARIEAYEWDVTNYGEGNYTEGFLIDNSTLNSNIGHLVYGRRWAVGDVDNDGLNEFILGTTSRVSFCGGIGGHLWKYDIGTNGSTVNRSTLAAFSNTSYFGGYEMQTINPVMVDDSGTNKIVVGVTGWVVNTNTQWTDVILLTYSPPPEYNYIYTIIEGTVLISVLGGAYYYLKRRKKKKFI